MAYSFVEYSTCRYQRQAFDLLDLMRKIQYNVVPMPLNEIEKNSTPLNTSRYVNEMNALHYRTAYDRIIKDVLQPKPIDATDEILLKLQRCFISQIASYRNPHLKSSDVLIDLVIAGMAESYIAFSSVAEMERIAFSSAFLHNLTNIKIAPNQNWVNYWMDSIYDPNFKVEDMPPCASNKAKQVIDLLNYMQAERRLARQRY